MDNLPKRFVRVYSGILEGGGGGGGGAFKKGIVVAVTSDFHFNNLYSTSCPFSFIKPFHKYPIQAENTFYLV